MNEQIKQLAEQAGLGQERWNTTEQFNSFLARFSELIIQECLDKIETYRIPCGNSAAGEMAAEWTYDALKDIRNDIKETFGVEE